MDMHMLWGRILRTSSKAVNYKTILGSKTRICHGFKTHLNAILFWPCPNAGVEILLRWGRGPTARDITELK